MMVSREIVVSRSTAARRWTEYTRKHLPTADGLLQSMNQRDPDKNRAPRNASPPLASERSVGTVLEELLVLRCQEGDTKALTELVNRWHPSLRGYAFQLIGDREAARDVVQDAWIAVMRGIRRLKDPATFRGWIYRIVHNKSVDWIRGQQRRRQAIQEVAHHSTNATPAPDSQGDRLAELRRAIASMSQNDRAVLRLHYLNRLPIKEIAQVIRVPEGTVKSRLYSARIRLKQLLEANQDERI